MSVWAASVDIGGTSTKLGLVNDEGAIEFFRRLNTRPPVERFLRDLRKHLTELISLRPDIAGIGVSVAGFLDPLHSAMTYNPNIPWLVDVPLQRELSSAFGFPVKVEVDSNAATLGEYRFGEGAGHSRFLFLTVGTGIGVGMTIGGKLLRLAHECLGDAGHVVVDPSGPLCACGGAGCAEAVASAPAILLRSGAQSLADVNDAVFATAGAWLGQLTASLAAIFFPDRIALGGGVTQASRVYVERAISSFHSFSGDLIRQTTTVVPARLGAHASLIGAACPLFEAQSR